MRILLIDIRNLCFLPSKNLIRDHPHDRAMAFGAEIGLADSIVNLS